MTEPTLEGTKLRLLLMIACQLVLANAKPVGEPISLEDFQTFTDHAGELRRQIDRLHELDLV